MDILPHAQNPVAPRSKQAVQISFALATVFIVMAVAQLVRFDEFLVLVESMWLPGGRVTAHVVASMIVSTEVLAIPFLLRMPLSHAMRGLSMLCAMAASALWLWISLHVNLSVMVLPSAGMLGSLVALIPGWWMVFVSCGLLIATLWSWWGMWPYRLLSKNKKRT